jgi:hypothetical protein
VQGDAGWARSLCGSLQHYLGCIFPGLAGEAQAEVSRAVLERLLYRVEAAVSSKKFTALGGLLLDRDVRALTSGMADATGQPVRERFARLHQIVLLLTQESTAEVEELWGDASVAWRLSPAEVRSVLACRVDLDRAALASLALE